MSADPGSLGQVATSVKEVFGTPLIFDDISVNASENFSKQTSKSMRVLPNIFPVGTSHMLFLVLMARQPLPQQLFLVLMVGQPLNLQPFLVLMARWSLLLLLQLPVVSLRPPMVVNRRQSLEAT